MTAPVMTLEQRRVPVLELFTVQETDTSASRNEQAISIGELERAWTAEGRPAAEFVAWLVRGADEAGGGIALTRPVAYERRHAAAAINAGLTDFGVTTYSHLVHAGMHLHAGRTVPEVVDLAVKGELKRKPSASTPGISKVQVPDTHLVALEQARERVKQAYQRVGAPLPDNAPEVMAGLIDLIGSMADGVLDLAAADAVDTLERYMQSRAERTRMVHLTVLDAGGDSLAPLMAVWGSDYVSLLNAERPTWSICQVRENGEFQVSFRRESDL